MSSERRHLASLDGVRGLSIVWVLLFHFCNSDYSQAHGPLRIAGWIINEGFARYFLRLKRYFDYSPRSQPRLGTPEEEEIPAARA